MSNFFDLAHFEHIHGVSVASHETFEANGFMGYRAEGTYLPHYPFQRIFFSMFPNRLKQTVWYRKNIIISHHALFTKSGTKAFEYFALLPTAPVGEHGTRVTSTVFLRKSLSRFVPDALVRSVFSKAVVEEFTMLE